MLVVTCSVLSVVVVAFAGDLVDLVRIPVRVRGVVCVRRCCSC